MNQQWRSAKLSDHHDTSQFDCGVPEMNAWLRDHALRVHRAGSAMVRVWLPPDSNEVMAFHAITPTQVLREELRSTEHGGFSVVPAHLIARLAIDRRLQGQGYGTDLLLDAIELIHHAASIAGGRLIVVDALDETTARFYIHHGFHPVKNQPLRLVMKMATAIKILHTAALNITADSQFGLAALEIQIPDGTSTATLLNADEAARVAERLVALAGQTPMKLVDLRTEIRTAIGRDVFEE